MSTRKINSIQFQQEVNGKIAISTIYQNGTYHNNRILDIIEHESNIGTFSYIIERYAIGNMRIFNPIWVKYFSD